MSSSPKQANLFLFEKPQPKGKAADLLSLVKTLGISKVREPMPPTIGGTWSDDAQISQPHYKRDPDFDIGSPDDVD